MAKLLCNTCFIDCTTGVWNGDECTFPQSIFTPLKRADCVVVKEDENLSGFCSVFYIDHDVVLKMITGLNTTQLIRYTVNAGAPNVLRREVRTITTS